MKILLLSLTAALLSFTPPSRADDFDSAGVRIHYTVEGAGDPVILIHGLYASAMMNWGLPGITSDLAKSYQVIALDCRGHGKSDKPEGEDQYGHQMAEDVVRLMDHLKIPKAHIVGYSMGGMIAMKLVVTHPDRVRSIVLGGMGWLKTGSPQQQFWSNLKGRESLPVPVSCVRSFADFAVSESEVKAVRAPVIMIVGERDPCRRLYVEPLAQARPDWPVHIIDGAGHISCVTTPEFKAEVHAALDKNKGA